MSGADTDLGRHLVLDPLAGHVDLAVELQPGEPGRRGDQHRGARSDALGVPEPAAPGPQRVLARALQARAGAEDRERPAVDPGVALLEHVAQPQLERVEVERGLAELMRHRMGWRGELQLAAPGAHPVMVRADPHANDLARACALALWRGQPQRVLNVCDDTDMKMGDYFDLAADLMGLPRPPRIPRSTASEALPLMLLSFMKESRRLDNTRMKTELRLRLNVPHVRQGLSPQTGLFGA